MESEGIKTTEADNDARRSFFIVFKAPRGSKSICAIGFSYSFVYPCTISKFEELESSNRDFTKTLRPLVKRALK